MKFREERPFADVDAAVKKLLEIANGMAADHAGRLSVGILNTQFKDASGSYPEYSAAVKAAIDRGYITVSRSPPDNSCMYPSWISRSLCSAGIARCIKPLAQSRNETNSSWVNGADKSGCIFQICASGAAVQASHLATIKLTHYPSQSVIFSD